MACRTMNRSCSSSLSNQRGYPDERLARFEPEKIIEIL
jgi:hypothetical protein